MTTRFAGYSKLLSYIALGARSPNLTYTSCEASPEMANVSKAGWDVFLFGNALIGFLVFGFFRLDQVFTFRKGEKANKPTGLPAANQHERSMCSDPNGRPWDKD